MDSVSDDAKGGYWRVEILTGPGRRRNWSDDLRGDRMKHDHPIGLTLAEGARRWCDSAIVEALAAAAAEAARFEAMDLLPGRHDTHSGMLKSAAYFEAEHQRCQLLDDLRRRLLRGELVATARERPIGPRIAVADEAWQYLYPRFADDTARDGMGTVVLFQVRIAEAAPAKVSLAQDAMPPAVTAQADPKPVYSVSTLRAWYLPSAAVPGRPPSSRRAKPTTSPQPCNCSIHRRASWLRLRVGSWERVAAEPLCTAPGFLDTGLHYAARLRLVSRRAARASSGLR